MNRRPPDIHPDMPWSEVANATIHLTEEEAAIVEYLYDRQNPVPYFEVLKAVPVGPRDFRSRKVREGELMRVIFRLCWELKIVRDSKANTLRLHRAYREVLRRKLVGFGGTKYSWEHIWRDKVLAKPRLLTVEVFGMLRRMENPRYGLPRVISPRGREVMRRNMALAQAGRIESLRSDLIRRISERRQVVIPVGIREEHGLLVGVVVYFREHEGRLFLYFAPGSGLPRHVLPNGRVAIPKAFYDKCRFSFGMKLQWFPFDDYVVIHPYPYEGGTTNLAPPPTEPPPAESA
jgi:hypothetical protein